MLEGLQTPKGGYVGPLLPLMSPGPPSPLPTSFFPCVALVMPFSSDTISERSRMFTRLSGAKSLRHPLALQILGEWVASPPLAKARWYEATEVPQVPLICNKQIEAVKQYASVLFPAPELIGLV